MQYFATHLKTIRDLLEPQFSDEKKPPGGGQTNIDARQIIFAGTALTPASGAAHSLDALRERVDRLMRLGILAGPVVPAAPPETPGAKEARSGG